MTVIVRLLLILAVLVALVAGALAVAVIAAGLVGSLDPMFVAVLSGAILLALVVALRPLLDPLVGGLAPLLQDGVPIGAPETIEIEVPVPASSDPAHVVALLRQAAAGNPHLGADAEVELGKLTNGALHFVLRATVANRGRARTSASEVRLAILALLRGAGIGLPNDQIDVHMRDLDGLKSALATFMAERARQAAEKSAERQSRSFSGESEPALKPSNDDD
ncbi:MAG: hypothetical protein AB1749_02190 [Pseudomonadota bacterium]